MERVGFPSERNRESPRGKGPKYGSVTMVDREERQDTEAIFIVTLPQLLRSPSRSATQSPNKEVGISRHMCRYCFSQTTGWDLYCTARSDLMPRNSPCREIDYSGKHALNPAQISYNRFSGGKRSFEDMQLQKNTVQMQQRSVFQ